MKELLTLSRSKSSYFSTYTYVHDQKTNNIMITGRWDVVMTDGSITDRHYTPYDPPQPLFADHIENPQEVDHG